MRDLSPVAVGAMNDDTSDEVWLILLTLTHPSLSAPLRLVNNMEDITSRGDVYTALSFEVRLPDQDPDTATVAQLRIDNVDQRIVAAVRALQSPPKVDLEVILASDPDEIEIAFTDMTLRNVTYDQAYVTGELSFEAIFVEPVSLLMTPARFPGMF